jgi:hypothetical protein
MKTNNILYYILLAIAAGILGGVNAQTTPNGDLRECTTRGWNTCDRWDHCYWRGTKKSGVCFNDCDRILQIGTPRDCSNLRGCMLNRRRTKCYRIPRPRMLQADSKPEATVSVELICDEVKQYLSILLVTLSLTQYITYISRIQRPRD